jgi:hypothetical protein
VALKSEAATQWRPADKVVREQIGWWADRVERRLLGEARRLKGYKTGESKPPWDRERFLEQFRARVPGHPDGPELADKFEAALREARGNPTRFRDELGRLLA